MRPTRILQATAPLALLTLSAGCQTTIGSYFGNRARDFGECFALHAGFGAGLGVDVEAAGVLHVAVGGAMFLRPFTLGWGYGYAYPHGSLHDYSGSETAMGSFSGFPFLVPSPHGLPMWSEYPHMSHMTPHDYHGCYFILPAVTDWFIPGNVGDTYRERPGRAIVWARIHSFDIEASFMALFIGARVGFSPGEFLDFLLGWVGIDIAEDDVGLESDEPPPEEAESAREVKSGKSE